MPSRKTCNPINFLGIDTSAYTTSVAVVDDEGNLVADARRVIPVPLGRRGIRPADAVFHHVRQFDALWEETLSRVSPAELAGVAVSTKPRPLPDSYLPPFAVGAAFAHTIARTAGIPMVSTTHQEGHLMAGLWSAGGPPDPEFYALHLSGGTTELLRVHRESSGFRVELCGNSEDLYVGQWIDRVGVAMGLPFPAGPHLERLAAGSTQPPSRFAMGKPRRRSDGRVTVSFSGPEADARRRLEAGEEPRAVARAVEETVAVGLAAWVTAAMAPGPLLVVGGVGANRYISGRLHAQLDPAAGWRLYAAAPAFSRDNAVGAALIARNFFAKGLAEQ